MSNKIFTLILVTYDYYRFQDNVFASNSKMDCIKKAKELNKTKNCDSSGDINVDPIRFYQNKGNVYYMLNKKEINHFWIQEFNQANEVKLYATI